MSGHSGEGESPPLTILQWLSLKLAVTFTLDLSASP
jgi:hypothetical protein